MNKYSAEQAWDKGQLEDLSCRGENYYGMWYISKGGAFFSCGEPGCCDVDFNNKERFIEYIGKDILEEE